MNDTTSRVPLPEHLKECGCLWAASGRHLVSCVPAREYDAIPLHEHPEYEMGRVFQAISWQYPLRLEGTVRVTVELDPVAYIANHRDEYEAFELDRSYEEWEKPMVWLWGKIEEGCDDLWASLPFGRTRVESHADARVDEVTEYPTWGPDDTDHLHAALPPVVDPNQGALL